MSQFYGFKKMSKRSLGWMFFPAMVFLWSCARACEAPTGTNFSNDPGYWCSVEVRVVVSTGCDIEVEEIINLPWTTGVLNRRVPTEDNQRIEDVLAYRLLNGVRTANLSVTQRRQEPNNRLLSVQVGEATEPVSILVMYKKIGGVVIFSQCSGIGRFKPVPNSEANTVMLSEWAMGGRSIFDVQQMTVTFLLNKQKLNYISTFFMHGEGPSQVSNNDANTATNHVSVKYKGHTAGLSPSLLFFYIQYYMPLGGLSCPVSRNCEYEKMILNEGQSSDIKNKILIGVSLTVALIVIAGSVAALVVYCKRVKERQLDSNVEKETLPESLRHFEYDTGDDQTREKRAEQVWMSNKSNDMKEEFYALDLSPRDKGKKSSEGF